MNGAAIEERGRLLRALHAYNDLLVLVNVWDVASARVVAGLPGCRAIATASHSIAAAHGFPDGEQIPVDDMLTAAGRIAAATELPVTADLESGYGDAGETVRRAIELGVVGANIEDQMVPLPEATARMQAVVTAAESEGVPFALNARTDAFVLGRGRVADDLVREAIERGRAFLDVGATSVFVPGLLDEKAIAALVDGIGERRVSTIGYPGCVPLERQTELGVARVSYGPQPQRLTLTVLAEAAASLLAGGPLPEGIRELP